MNRKHLSCIEDLIKIFDIRHMNYNLNQLKEIFDLWSLEKQIKQHIDTLRQKKNLLSKSFTKENALECKDKSDILSEDITNNTNKLKTISERLTFLLDTIPNDLHEDVPFGKNEKDNVVIKQWRDIIFSKHHYEMDIFEDTVNFTGSRFVTLKGDFATLERALGNFMLDFLIKNGFKEYDVPVIFKREFCENTRHAPKELNNIESRENNMFCLGDSFLIPTGEVALLSVFANKDLEQLPIKICTLSNCFRKEAGAAGKDTKGLMRVHQFKKVEMVVAEKAEKSREMLNKMVSYSCEILEALELPYRILSLCTGDMGFGSHITFDLEIPIGGFWREVASISNTKTFQSFSLNVTNNGELVHLLNGSALALGRTLASLLEVHYKDGFVHIPKVLRSYFAKEIIKIN